jgi:hypothetical protein
MSTKMKISRAQKCRRETYFRALFFPPTLFPCAAGFAGACFPATRSFPCAFAAAPAFAACALEIASTASALPAPFATFFGGSFFFGGSLIPDNFRNIFSRSSGVFPRPVN